MIDTVNKNDCYNISNIKFKFLYYMVNIKRRLLPQAGNIFCYVSHCKYNSVK